MRIRYFTHGRRDVPAVSLTFDDGPNPPRTEQVLDILAEEGAVATFFVIGKWVARWPETVRRIMRAGHVVGNHSHTHVLGMGDYDEGEAAIAHVTGRASQFARAPAFDYASCAQSPLITSGELVLVDADVNPADWNSTNPDEITKAVLTHPSLQPGSIIDLHDSAEYPEAAKRISRPLPMIRALPAIVRGLKDRGYKLAGLDDLTLVDPVEWDPEHTPAPHRAARPQPGGEPCPTF